MRDLLEGREIGLTPAPFSTLLVWAAAKPLLPKTRGMSSARGGKKMAKLFSVLRYRDPAAAIDWLDQALGFKPHFIAREDGKVVHAQLRLGDSLIMIGPDHSEDPYGMQSPLSLSGTNQCVYVATDEDVDGACRRAEQAGADIVTRPYDTAYGSREFTCRDFEGHIWSVGSYAGEPLDR